MHDLILITFLGSRGNHQKKSLENCALFLDTTNTYISSKFHVAFSPKEIGLYSFSGLHEIVTCLFLNLFVLLFIFINATLNNHNGFPFTRF